MTREEPRTLTMGTQNHTKILCTDQPGPGGACHQYEIMKSETNLSLPLTVIQFQKGGVKETGEVNGIFMEDLLNIVLDRLEHFQGGPLSCYENQKALGAVENAFYWLARRMTDRKYRGIERRSKV